MKALISAVRHIALALSFVMASHSLVESVHAQEMELEIVTNADSAAVFADGAWVGLAVDGPFRIPAATREVVVRAPGAGIWSIDPLRFELDRERQGRLSLKASFPFHYRFESIPSGASVFAGSQRIGVTPMLHKSDRPLNELVRMELKGFHATMIEPGSAIWNHVPVRLEPNAQVNEAVRSNHIVEEKRPNWVNIAVSASALAAGALAVHYRTKADNRFDDFGVTGKASLRSDIRRLDVQSGVALGVMQAGLGFVAFRLAF